MDEDNFFVSRMPSGQGEERELLSGDNRFYVCLRSIRTNALKMPTLDFCISDNFYWDDGDSGYVVSFRKSFFTRRIWCNLKSMQLFRGKDSLSFVLDAECELQVMGIFDKMYDTLNSGYFYKYDLLRNYLFEIVHLAIKKSGAKFL